MANKVCKTCGQRKIVSLEFFDKDVSGKLGFRDTCKVCTPEVKISYFQPKIKKVEEVEEVEEDNSDNE